MSSVPVKVNANRGISVASPAIAIIADVTEPGFGTRRYRLFTLNHQYHCRHPSTTIQTRPASTAGVAAPRTAPANDPCHVIEPNAAKKCEMVSTSTQSIAAGKPNANARNTWMRRTLHRRNVVGRIR